ncbi:response regulator transcription factor [Streptomyces sp. NBC_01431]|uniref:response regulator transcription factor n=1 Tax=Streptomyces sp. NBC_01431 TaxID=2903863 RepID=UPI002E35993B|nr:LuxR C-terminal-related transcriptional regulator [Streptomyces sp. NBC_01431]
MPLAVLASDPITCEGAQAYFQACGQVRLVASGRPSEAEVVAMFATQVTDETLMSMRRLSAAPSRSRTWIVLSADGISEARMLRAVRYGLVGFVPRSQAGMESVLQAVLDSRKRRAEPPDVLVRSLMDQIRTLRDGPQESQGLCMARLKEREVVVLKLLAEGLDTAEVADALNYSDRTIKNVLAGMMDRLGLRNRAHAIAYAMRSGAL